MARGMEPDMVAGNLAYALEFCHRALNLLRPGGRPMEAVAKEIGIPATTMTNCVPSSPA